MVSAEGLLDGGTASLIILSSVIFGLLSFYKSRKLKAKLLTVAGLLVMFVGLLWLGPTIDLLHVVFLEHNIDPIHVYSIFSYMWVAPALICAMYLGGELLVPKRKWLLIAIYFLLGYAFELFLWLDTKNSFEFTLDPDKIGEDLIDASFIRTHPTFMFIAFFLISTLIFLGIGFAIKAKQSTGLLRRKFTYLSIANIIFVSCGALDSILTLLPVIGIVRVVMATFAIWMYLGLKT